MARLVPYAAAAAANPLRPRARVSTYREHPLLVLHVLLLLVPSLPHLPLTLRLSCVSARRVIFVTAPLPMTTWSLGCIRGLRRLTADC